MAARTSASTPERGTAVPRLPAGEEQPVWMSHGDRIEALPPGFRVIGESAELPGGRGRRRRSASFCGVQFHPEVAHTPARRRDPARTSCSASASCEPSWTMASFVEEAVARVRKQVGRRAAAMLRPVGRRRLVGGGGAGAARDRRAADLHLRRQRACCAKGEARAGRGALRATRSRPTCASSTPSARFLDALAGVTDPEQKRKIIGREFIDVFEEEAEEASAARRLPGAGHALSRRDRVACRRKGPVGDDQDRTTTSAACPSA